MKAQLIDVGHIDQKSIRIKIIRQKYLTTPFHFHEMCELAFVKESFGKCIVGDYIGNFKEGDLLLLGPNLPHVLLNDNVFKQPGSKKGVHAIVIYFPPDFLLNLMDDPHLNSLIQSLITRSQRGLQFYGKTKSLIIEKINSLMNKKGLKKMLDFLGIIDTVLDSREWQYLASVGYKNSISTRDVCRFNEIYQYLNKNFHEKITLKEVANMANMSPSAFCRFFKLKSQKSFSIFINELRIGHACKLLLDDELSITSIAFECGYQNLTNFNKFFKRITGLTPSRYKRNLSLSSVS
jgi:AraC-like DNA-binding protein